MVRRRTLFEWWSHDIAIDLGTANTLVALGRKGVVINEPSLVAYRGDKEIIAIGDPAHSMRGRSPNNYKVKRPLVDGVVADFEATEMMLKHFISKIHRQYKVMNPRPRVVVGLPATVTDVERRAVSETVKGSGARKVYMIEEPIAAALGSGVPVFDSKGSIVVDIGGGTTEVALISYGGITITKSLRTAGDEISEAIIEQLKEDAGLQIGLSSAEDIKKNISVSDFIKSDKSIKIRGKDVLSGLPKQVDVRSEYFSKRIIQQLRPIIDTVKATLDESPTDLLIDISQKGIIVTGGGALINGLSELMEKELKVKINIPDNSLTTVVEGASMVLQNPEIRKRLSESGRMEA